MGKVEKKDILSKFRSESDMMVVSVTMRVSVTLLPLQYNTVIVTVNYGVYNRT